MKILYGNVIEQNAGWGTECLLNKAFQDLGHETYCVDYRANRYRIASSLRKAPPCDVFFLQRGDLFPVPIIRNISLPSFFWATELVSRRFDQHRLLKVEKLFKHVFMRTPECIDRVVRNGWRAPETCSILLGAFDPDLNHPIPDMKKDLDVLFVGNITPRRAEWIDRMREEKISIHAQKAFGSDMNILFNRARIVLSVHAEDYLDTETRIYEALGSGSFLLTEKLSSENPFSENDLIQFDSFEDMIEKIAYYLDHDEERQRIASHGLQSALARHTYRHRAQEIIQVFIKHLPEPYHRPEALFRSQSALMAYQAFELFARPVYLSWRSLRPSLGRLRRALTRGREIS